MARIIKAPNVQEAKPYPIVERDKVLRHANEEAADIIAAAQQQEESILISASQQGDEIVAGAKQEAEGIIADAQAEGEQIKEAAREEGAALGLQQGLDEAREQAASILQEMAGMMAEGQRILEGKFQEQEQEIRELVAEIVSRVVQEKIALDDEIVVRVARECIRIAADRQSVRILVHPDDKAKIEEWVPQFTQMFDDIEKLSIASDPRVGRGGVIIESGTGGVDGRIEKQVEILNETLINP
ncbi:MAG: FliH/SctL family protein [Candidatus Omnitrophota bacterium]